jgi:voltage-gated potassium channel
MDNDLLPAGRRLVSAGLTTRLLVLLLVCAIVVAIAEKMPVRQAVYFMLVTALTIGYGDITPATPLGRAASITAGAIGVLNTGIIVAVATRALERAYRERREADDRKAS